MRLANLALMSLLLASCYQEPPEGFPITLDMSEFAAGEVTHVELYILEECPNSFVLDASVEVLDQAGIEVDDPSPQEGELSHRGLGTYGIMAIGTTRDCTIRGVACREVTVEEFVVEDIVLRLSPQTPVTCDWPSTCSAEGVCDVVGDSPPPFQACLVNNPPPYPITQLAAGDNHTCVSFDDGVGTGATVYCWGDNSFNQINNDAASSFPEPEISGTPRSLMMGAGGNTWCGATSNSISCRGNGELLTTQAYADNRLLEASAVHACLLSDAFGGEDIMRCWGDNDDGQLLDPSGTPTTFLSPHSSLFPGGSLVGLAVGVSEDGAAYTCYATATQVSCAGSGPGIGSSVALPLSWVGTNIQEMTGGDRHACLIDSGAVYCWGDNDEGQLGIETFGVRLEVPTRVGTATDWDSVSAGGDTTCGIRAGELFCWGRNDNGQAGRGPDPTRLPRSIDGTDDWTKVAVGKDHTCGATLGVLWCWGRGNLGQLGGEGLHSKTPNLQQVCFP